MKRKISILPFVLVAVVIFLLNAYALSGIHTLSSSPLITPVFVVLIVAIIIALIFAITRISVHGMSLTFKIISHVFLTLLAAELVLAVILFFGDAYRLIAGVPRSVYWVEFAFFMVLVVILLFIYGMIFGKYNYKVIRHVLYFDDLPAAFDGFTLVQISDIHSGSFKNPAAVRRGIELVNAQKADLFVFTGDLVNFRAEEIVPWIADFSKIKAPYGQYSVLGNHDYGGTTEADKIENLKKIKQYHQELGFDLLLDRHVEICKDESYINLAGVENWGIGFGERGDLKKAMAGTRENDFTVLLSHDPTHWEAQAKVFTPKIHLTLSGHTHGMQFGIEAFGIKWSPVKYRYAHWAGLKEENGRMLNVNRGFGFIGFSGRVGIWPEITVIELKKSVAGQKAI
jgi:predicted MPP superfamily phosphohydrolase